MIHSFPPCADEHTRILIVGSMPGGASLKAGEYYAYKHNQFWRLMFDLLAGGRTPESYRDKLNTLLIHHIGLWDALESCERKGSLDGSITRPHPNDFPSLFKRFTALRTHLLKGHAARTRVWGACRQKLHHPSLHQPGARFALLRREKGPLARRT